MIRVLFAALCALCFNIAQSVAYDPITEDPLSVDAEHPPTMKEVHFESNGSRLNGQFYLANGAGPHPTVVLLHGYPGNEKNLDVLFSMRRAGFNVLFFHYRGAWGSEGDFRFTHVIEDVGAALDFVRETAAAHRVDVSRLSIVGHSMGGFAALQGGARDKDVVCVAGLAASDFGAYPARFEGDEEARERFVAYADGLAMLNGFSGAIGLEELTKHTEDFSVVRQAPAYRGRRVLLIAGAKDRVVPQEVIHIPMIAAFEAADAVLTTVMLNADHGFSTKRMALQRTVVEWLDGCR